jgi:hypothetical protein
MDFKSESSVTNSRVDAGSSGEMDAILITSPAEMANVLFQASPKNAADFARTMHERACYSQNVERMDFWLTAIDEIADRVTQCTVAQDVQRQIEAASN